MAILDNRKSDRWRQTHVMTFRGGRAHFTARAAQEAGGGENSSYAPLRSSVTYAGIGGKGMIPHLSFPFVPFLPSLTCPFLLRKGPFNPARRSRGRCNLSLQAWAEPAVAKFLCILSKKSLLVIWL